MKKFISIILCVAMTVGIMATSVFALEYFAGEKATSSPVIDGKISDGEYSWTSGKLNAQKVTLSSPIVNKLYASVNVKDSLTDFEFFMSYDDEYIYVAYKETGTNETEVWFDLNPRDGQQGQIFTYVSANKDRIDSVTTYESTSASAKTDKTSKYVVASSGKGHAENGVNSNHIEVKFSRAALEEYAGGKFDRIGFRAVVQRASGANGELFYADGSNPSSPYWFYENYGHHIINLNNNGKNPEDMPGKLTVDGVVGENEYGWTSEALDRNNGVANRFFVVDPHSDSQSLTSQWWMDYDGEYIYIAYKERGHGSTQTTKTWIDLDPCVDLESDAQLLIYVQYAKDNTKPANTGSDILSGITIREYSADGKYTEVNGSKYIVEAQASWFDDTARNNNTIELKISVKALRAYAGKSFETFGFRGVNQSHDGEAILCNTLSHKSPLDFHTDKSYIVMELGGNGDVTEKIFEIDPSHVHDIPSFKFCSETQHTGTCNSCGSTEYEFHIWNDGEITKEATETEEGIILYTCIACEATDEDVIPSKSAVSNSNANDNTAQESSKAEASVDNNSCGSSLAMISVTLIMMLGACTVFVTKKS